MEKEFFKKKTVTAYYCCSDHICDCRSCFLCLAYMLPTDKMKANVAAAYDLFMDERVYHDWSNDVEYTRLDYVLYELGYRSGIDDVTFWQVLTEKIKVLAIKPLLVFFGIYAAQLIVREHSLHTFAYRELAGSIMAAMLFAESFLPVAQSAEK